MTHSKIVLQVFWSLLRSDNTAKPKAIECYSNKNWDLFIYLFIVFYTPLMALCNKPKIAIIVYINSCQHKVDSLLDMKVG